MTEIPGTVHDSVHIDIPATDNVKNQAEFHQVTFAVPKPPSLLPLTTRDADRSSGMISLYGVLGRRVSGRVKFERIRINRSRAIFLVPRTSYLVPSMMTGRPYGAFRMMGRTVLMKGRAYGASAVPGMRMRHGKWCWGTSFGKRAFSSHGR